MRVELEKGFLDISSEVITTISGYAATSCFGVIGMAPASVGDGIVRLLKKESLSRGVRVTTDKDNETVAIELHIIVRHGVNISTVSRSIIHEVRYVVENLTGIKVKSVDICVDSIMSD
ncbi:MAG: Asp23/Gls24 family envelope stress response protein [Eubacteriales bacterium]